MNKRIEAIIMCPASDIPKLPTKSKREATVTAEEHKDADARCGREWSCTCGACRIARRLIQQGGGK